LFIQETMHEGNKSTAGPAFVKFVAQETWLEGLPSELACITISAVCIITSLSIGFQHVLLLPRTCSLSDVTMFLIFLVVKKCYVSTVSRRNIRMPGATMFFSKVKLYLDIPTKF